MKKCLALAIAAGAASSFASSSALAAKTETPEIGRAYSAGSVYVNAKTGERVVLKGFESREGPERWNNRDSTNNGNFFSGIDNPTRSTTSVRPRFGAEVLDTGDIAAAPGVGALVDGFRLSYATDIAGVLSDATVPGLDMTIWFYDNDNSTLNNDTRAQALAGFVIGDLNGTQGSFNSWSFTIDLAGGDEIQLGDQDLDGDGGLDFGWSIAFQQNQTTPAKGTIGPTLVLPGGYGYTNGVNSTSTSTGVKNGWEWFAPLVFNSSGQAAAGHQTYLTSTTTSWAASVPPSASGFQPFLSTAIILYGAESCAADFNGDGFIDFTDFDDFVFAFEGGDPSSDFNQDGFLDFTDFDAFVAAFEAGC